MSSIIQNIQNYYTQFSTICYETKEAIIKRLKFCCDLIVYENINLLYAAYYQCQYYLNPHKYNINPINIPVITENNKIAKVVLLIPGQGSNESLYSYLLSKIHRLVYIFSAKDTYSPQNPIPIEDLQNRINEIAQKFSNKGYRDVEFTLIGHSLGGIRSFSLINSNLDFNSNIKISQIITFASRLFYDNNHPCTSYDNSICGDQIDQINANHQKFIDYRPKNLLVHTLAAGDNDWLFPSTYSCIPEKTRLKNEIHETFPETCHLSILFSDKATNRAREIIQNWCSV